MPLLKPTKFTPEFFETQLKRDIFHILSEKAEGLREETKGLLCGEIELSRALSRSDIDGSFYIVANKGDYHYALLDIMASQENDYPLKIYNYIDCKLKTISSEKAYRKYISQFFAAPDMSALLEKLKFK